MKYKVEILKIGSDKSIDIPEGCTPIKYDCSLERRDLSVSLVRTLTILRPIENIEEKKIEEEIEKKCFFCEENLTRDKIGIRPICAICLGKLYGMTRESHKSLEC